MKKVLVALMLLPGSAMAGWTWTETGSHAGQQIATNFYERLLHFYMSIQMMF